MQEILINVNAPRVTQIKLGRLWRSEDRCSLFQVFHAYLFRLFVHERASLSYADTFCGLRTVRVKRVRICASAYGLQVLRGGYTAVLRVYRIIRRSQNTWGLIWIIKHPRWKLTAQKAQLRFCVFRIGLDTRRPTRTIAYYLCCHVGLVSRCVIIKRWCRTLFLALPMSS